jgi:hypothetical protein
MSSLTKCVYISAHVLLLFFSMQRVTLHCAFHVPLRCVLHTRVKLLILHLHEVKSFTEDICTMRLHESIAFMLSTPVSYPRLGSLSVPHYPNGWLHPISLRVRLRRANEDMKTTQLPDKFTCP